MKVSDYLVSRLADAGVSHVFMLTGGGAMHLNDSFGKEPRMRYVCNHHEQACAMAAEGYARIAGRPAAVNVTTGPGGLNALNGVWGAYTDSLPMIVLSGQVKRETCMSTYPGMALRQLGDQEVDIVRIASAITKYAVMLREPNRARYEIEKAIHLATTGRPGPVWIDVPIDVQASTIDPDELEPYMPPPPAAADAARLRAQCDDLVARIRKAERPAILLGSGIRVGHAEAELERVIRKLQIPVTTSWTAIDLLGSDDPLYCGRPGSVGDRPGNFTIQNSDLVITLGSRLPIRQVSYNFAAFAHHAFKVQVDIDPAELEKPYGKPDLGIVADLREFLIALDANLGAAQPDPRHAKWLAWCKERLARYPVVLPKHSAPAKLINPYHFSKVIFEHLEADDVVACGDGTASVVPFQASPIKLGQRLFTNAGSASMGYDLPAAIGAAVARGGKRAICFAGDGSLQLNLQELQTVVHNKLAIKIFVFNNGGYVSIRQSQKNFFGRLVGEGPESGISFPDIVEVARAYGIPGVRVFGPDFMPQILPLLSAPGPAVFDVMLDPNHIFEPKVASKQLPDGRMVSAPLEDMGPFLDREELLENMLVPPLDY